MRTNTKLLLLFLFNNILGQIILLLSLYYLNTNKIFIFEEGVYSKWNDSLLYFFPFLVTYIFLFIVFTKTIQKKQILRKAIKISKKTFLFYIFTIIILLFLLYLNLVLSGTPPLLQTGYISRFDYLQNTKLWFFLKVFGQPAVLLPILIGYILLQNKKYNFFKKNYIFYILILLYFFYVILIGQKFGAIRQGLFFILLPLFAHKILNKERILNLKVIISIISIIVFIILLISHHYSKLSNVQEFGGSINFIYYRIFGLQGHTFWGTIENLNNIQPSIELWWDGMHNIMRLIAPIGIERAIERGVNFTAGYPVILLLAFPIIFSYFIHIIILFFFFSFLRLWIHNLYNISYVIYAYIFVYLGSFLGHGSLKYLINAKIGLLIFILFIIYVTTKLFLKRKKNDYINHPNL